MKKLNSRNSRPALKGLAFCILATLGISVNASAGDRIDGIISSIDEQIEKIEVTGQRPLNFYRLDMIKSELDFYDTLNALTDNEEFKVSCSYRAPTGRVRKQTYCYPNYFRDQMQDSLRMGFDTAGLTNAPMLPPFTDKQVDNFVRDKKEAAMAYVEELVQKNPELKQKLYTMVEKQKTFEDKRNSI